ncbi:MAG: VWA domain-containing protein [archaeon]
MANRGLSGINAIFVARSIVFDLDSAIGTYGDEILKDLTGLPISELRRSEGKLERVSQISERIEKRSKLLSSEGYVTKEGGALTKKALKEIAEETLRDELEILSRLGHGTHPAKSSGFEERTELALPYSRGHSYKRISIRRTVSVAAKRGHGRIIREDLRSSEMTKRTGVDFVFVLDSSGSMKGDKLDSCKRAAIGLAAVSIGTLDRVAVIAFRKEPELICEFSDSEDVPYFAEKIVSLTPGGTTSIAKAVFLAAEILRALDRESAKHILLITDALPTEGEKPVEDARESVEKASAAGITISVAGIGLVEEGEKLARELSGIGEGNFYNVPVGELTGIVLDDRAKIG